MGMVRKWFRRLKKMLKAKGKRSAEAEETASSASPPAAAAAQDDQLFLSPKASRSTQATIELCDDNPATALSN